jgi:hypothetical protein
MPVSGSRSTYSGLLKASGLSQNAQAKFASVYLRHRGNSVQLREEVRKAGLDGAQIGKLQVQGKLTFIAGNSEAMTAQLMQKQITDLVQMTSRSWLPDPCRLCKLPGRRAAGCICRGYGSQSAPEYPTQEVGGLPATDKKFKLPVAHDATVTLLK